VREVKKFARRGKKNEQGRKFLVLKKGMPSIMNFKEKERKKRQKSILKRDGGERNELGPSVGRRGIGRPRARKEKERQKGEKVGRRNVLHREQEGRIGDERKKLRSTGAKEKDLLPQLWGGEKEKKKKGSYYGFGNIRESWG